MLFFLVFLQFSLFEQLFHVTLCGCDTTYLMLNVIQYYEIFLKMSSSIDN